MPLELAVTFLGGSDFGGAGTGRLGGGPLEDKELEDRWLNGGALSTSDLASRVSHGMYGASLEPAEEPEEGRELGLLPGRGDDFEEGLPPESTLDRTDPPWGGT